MSSMRPLDVREGLHRLPTSSQVTLPYFLPVGPSVGYLPGKPRGRRDPWTLLSSTRWDGLRHPSFSTSLVLQSRVALHSRHPGRGPIRLISRADSAS